MSLRARPGEWRNAKQETVKVGHGAPISRVLGLVALFSGAALVTHITSGVSLRLALASAAMLMAVSVGSFLRRARVHERKVMAKIITVGALSGLMATTAYDVAKFGLSHWDTSPYNPFEAIRVFGILLAGSSAPHALLYAAGIVFHVVNGITFGIGYCVLLGRRGVIAGILWGLFLETFQLTLYPGWLDIRAYREFAQISALSHVAYGAVLGSLCRHGLRERGGFGALGEPEGQRS